MMERKLELVVATDERWREVIESEASGESIIEEYALHAASQVVEGAANIDELRGQSNELNELNKEAAVVASEVFLHEDDQFELFARRTAQHATLAALELVKNKRRREVFRFRYIHNRQIVLAGTRTDVF